MAQIDQLVCVAAAKALVGQDKVHCFAKCIEAVRVTVYVRVNHNDAETTFFSLADQWQSCIDIGFRAHRYLVDTSVK